MEKPQTKAIELIKRSNTYKLIIPKEVEKKIRYLCSQVSEIEWSGTLFYTHEGSFEDNSLVIKCVDIFLMDIGTAAYTEFDMSPDVISYMVEHPELLDCQMGLIHSHNKMSTFFSGTDIATLKEEGGDSNHFVSLIVNNAGTYTAAITRKIKSSKIITDVYNYPTFNGENVSNSVEYTLETESLEYFSLDITIERDSVNNDELADRLAEVRKAKEAKLKVWNRPQQQSLFSSSNTIKSARENWLPFEEKKIEKDEEGFRELLESFDNKDGLISIPYGQVRFNEDIVNSVVAQLLTGSILIDYNKMDVNRWVEGMPAIFEKRFGEGEEGLKVFNAWANGFLDFICWYTDDPELIANGHDDGELSAILAYDVSEKLSELKENVYIKSYIEMLQNYIM